MGIITVGAGQIDTSFLDCLYTGGRLSAAQRDSILAGSDPSAYGLNPYDLYNLTCGRLGGRERAPAAFGLILLYSASSRYQAGDIVRYQAAGEAAPGLFQARQGVPAGTLPTAPGFWSPVVSPRPPIMAEYTPGLPYAPGALVTYNPAGTQRAGLYQLVQPAASGTPPTQAQWRALASAGPVVLLETDLLNPALAQVDIDESGALFQDVTAGVALPAVRVPASRRYVYSVSEIAPALSGGATPTDCHARVEIVVAESIQADGGVSVVATPRWVRIPIANASGPGAHAAGTLTARLRLELL